MDKNFASAHPEINLSEVSICCTYFILPGNVTDTALLKEWESHQLDEIMPFVRNKVEEIYDILKLLGKKTLTEKSLKSKWHSNLFLPDTENALTDVNWLKEEKSK